MTLARLLGAALALSLALAGCDDAGGKTVSGTIAMSPALQAKLGASDALFIIARRADAPGGPPLAVKKIIGMKFPLDYSFAQEDVMMPGTPFDGKVNIVARIRKSGNAMTAMPGDMEGSYPKNPVSVGSKGIDFAIDRMLTPVSP